MLDAYIVDLPYDIRHIIYKRACYKLREVYFRTRLNLNGLHRELRFNTFANIQKVNIDDEDIISFSSEFLSTYAYDHTLLELLLFYQNTSCYIRNKKFTGKVYGTSADSYECMRCGCSDNIMNHRKLQIECGQCRKSIS